MKVMYFVPKEALNEELATHLKQKSWCDSLELLATAKEKVWIIVLTAEHSLKTLALCKLRQQLVPEQKLIFLVAQKELCFLLYRYHLEVTAVIFYYAKAWRQELVLALHDLEVTPELCFRSKGRLVKVGLGQICYAESHYSNTHAAILWLIDKQTIQVSKNLHILEKENPCLLRSHQSYLLNPQNVYMLDKVDATVTFVNGLTCPVSRQKFKTLAERFA